MKMRRIHTLVGLLLFAFLQHSCINSLFTNEKPVKEDDFPSVEDIVDIITLKDDVIELQSLSDYPFAIIDDNSIRLSEDISRDKLPKKGSIIYYHPEETSKGMFIGKVVSIDSDQSGYVVNTELPAIEEVFKNLSLNATIDASNTTAVIDEDSDSNIISCEIVDDSVWDDIDIFYSDDDFDTDVKTNSSKADNGVPVNLSLAITVQPSDYFEGIVYIQLKGYLCITNSDSFILDVNMRVGINGSLHISTEGKTGKIELIPMKNGITLYTNKVIGVRLKPNIVFTYEGNVQIEAGFRYDLINTNIKSKCISYTFPSDETFAEKKDNGYFRVDGISAEGSFGIALEGKLFIFIFKETLLSMGIDILAGGKVQGELGANIDFPTGTGFDFSVDIIPYLSVEPYAMVKSVNGSKTYKGLKFELSSPGYRINLLPNFEDINYSINQENQEVSVSVEVSGNMISFIKTADIGIALFEKGKDDPVRKKSLEEGNGKTRFSGECSFKISGDKEYLIAPYVKTIFGEFVYGQMVTIQELEPDAIDLGLSVKWARFNLGASSPEHFGDYYAWGETKAKSSYLWSTYKWCNGSYNELTKYNCNSDYGVVDNNLVLDWNDDVAQVKLGEPWRMPTDADWTELRNNCTWIWTSQNGVNGRLVTSNINGASIFLPAAGSYGDPSLGGMGSDGRYWSSSLYTVYPNCALFVHFNVVGVGRYFDDRCSGFSIRPVFAE